MSVQGSCDEGWLSLRELFANAMHTHLLCDTRLVKHFTLVRGHTVMII